MQADRTLRVLPQCGVENVDQSAGVEESTAGSIRPTLVTTDDEVFNAWLAALEKRHLADLTFVEVSRALRALSATYVERRGRLCRGAALSGGGKRAAFALFYGPLHYLLVREIVRMLPYETRDRLLLVDLGCGGGASGAAWARICRFAPVVVGVDRHPWTLAEAARTYRDFGLRARTCLCDVATVGLP